LIIAKSAKGSITFPDNLKHYLLNNLNVEYMHVEVNIGLKVRIGELKVCNLSDL